MEFSNFKRSKFSFSKACPLGKRGHKNTQKNENLFENYDIENRAKTGCLMFTVFFCGIHDVSKIKLGQYKERERGCFQVYVCV